MHSSKHISQMVFMPFSFHRRYTYKALPEFGGFVFENGTSVKEWLDFVVGRIPNPLPRSSKANLPTRRRVTPPQMTVGGV